MLNFLIAFFTLNFIRKHLKTEIKASNLEQFVMMLNYFVVPGLLGIGFVIHDKYEPTENLLWILVFSSILYILFTIRSNSLANSLLKAGLPFLLVSCIKDGYTYFFPTYFENNKDVFEMIFIGGVLWMLAFGISANNQLKALKKEEEKNKIIVDENEKLEEMVKERTSEILAQKNQLESTVEELKATQNQLVQQEKLASLGELTAGIAHEIQNPLNFVNNFSELNVELFTELSEVLNSKKIIEKDSIEEELLRDLSQNMEKISHHGKRASSIVKGMLQHSRTSTGQKEATDINALADEFLRLSYHGLRAKDKTFNADFKTELDSDLPHIDAIPQDLGRVFLNLINNAFYACNERAKDIKASQSNVAYKPLVLVSTKKTEGTIEIKIQDNGSGISDENLEKIFQPFFTTKPTGKGTGLGLSLAYDIVTKGHGGNIVVESAEEKGTTFVINLPIK